MGRRSSRSNSSQEWQFSISTERLNELAHEASSGPLRYRDGVYTGWLFAHEQQQPKLINDEDMKTLASSFSSAHIIIIEAPKKNLRQIDFLRFNRKVFSSWVAGFAFAVGEYNRVAPMWKVRKELNQKMEARQLAQEAEGVVEEEQEKTVQAKMVKETEEEQEEEVEVLCDYERQRLERVSRNNEVLKNLGLPLKDDLKEVATKKKASQESASQRRLRKRNEELLTTCLAGHKIDMDIATFTALACAPEAAPPTYANGFVQGWHFEFTSTRPAWFNIIDMGRLGNVFSRNYLDEYPALPAEVTALDQAQLGHLVNAEWLGGLVMGVAEFRRITPIWRMRLEINRAEAEEAKSGYRSPESESEESEEEVSEESCSGSDGGADSDEEWEREIERQTRLQGLCPYEVQRLERVDRNNEMLQKLGIEDASKAMASPEKKPAKKKAKRPAAERRSYTLRQRNEDFVAGCFAVSDEEGEDFVDGEGGTDEDEDEDFSDVEDESAEPSGRKKSTKRKSKALSKKGKGDTAQGAARKPKAKKASKPAGRTPHPIPEAEKLLNEPKGDFMAMVARYDCFRKEFPEEAPKKKTVLGKWGDGQRQRRKGTGGRRPLSSEEAAMLEAVGFVWDGTAEGKKANDKLHAVAWDAKFAALVAFKEREGRFPEKREDEVL